jgi:hypothetical protein
MVRSGSPATVTAAGNTGKGLGGFWLRCLFFSLAGVCWSSPRGTMWTTSRCIWTSRIRGTSRTGGAVMLSSAWPLWTKSIPSIRYGKVSLLSFIVACVSCECTEVSRDYILQVFNWAGMWWNHWQLFDRWQCQKFYHNSMWDAIFSSTTKVFNSSGWMRLYNWKWGFYLPVTNNN